MNMRIILDLRGLVMRSYHSGEDLEPVIDSNGEKVNSASHAVNNFIRFYLQPILDYAAPINIIAVSEGGNDRRRALYEGYKTKRKARDKSSPEQKGEIDKALKSTQRLLAGLGVTLVQIPTVEADDAIAWLAGNLKGGKAIYTVDHDLAVLAKDDCFVYMGDQLVEGDGEVKGVPVRLVSLQKSIVGDTSDEYLGVRGMGAKAWEKLVAEFGFDGMDELMQIVDTSNFDLLKEIAEESGSAELKKLYEARDEWRIGWLLAKLHPEWCEGRYHDRIVTPNWYRRVPDYGRVVAALEDVGLGFFAEKFAKYAVKNILLDANSFEEDDLKFFEEQAKISPVVSFDFESTDKKMYPNYREARENYVDVLSQELTSVSINFGANLEYTIYIPFDHKDTANHPKERLLDFLGLVPEEVPLAVHNAAFELAVCQLNLGVFPDNLQDTRIMASYVNENTSNSLKDLSLNYLNYHQASYIETLEAAGAERMCDITGEQGLKYGCDDSTVTGHLYCLFRMILELENTWDFVESYEFDFVYPINDAFIRGVEVDWPRFRELEQHDSTRLEALDHEVRDILAAHCSQVNEEGFKFLKQELLPYERAVLKQKQKASDNGKPTDEEIEAKIKAKTEDLYKACAYRPFGPDPDVMNAPPEKKWGRVAKALDLPGLGNKKVPDTVLKWAEKIEAQAEEKGYAFNDNQRQFLSYLQGYCNDLKAKEEPTDALNKLCNRVLAADESLWSGDELNSGSPKQMIELFYGKLGLPIMYRNDVDKGSKRDVLGFDGSPSTDEAALRAWIAELEDESDWRRQVLEKTLEMRMLSTRMSLFYKPWQLFRNPETGRLHPQIKNCGTVTRRPSGSSPNFLQVPKVKDGGDIRKCVLPPNEDYVVVGIDFSQQELMILAALSGDPNLLACYVGDQKRDVHTMTAAGILKIPYEEAYRQYQAGEEPTSTVRKKKAKTTNFLMVYKGSAPGLSKKAMIPLREAEATVELFYRTYPGVGTYQENTIKFAEKHGYVLDPFGNRKHCEKILDKDRSVAAAAGRQAVNQPIQGGAASVLKMVMSAARKTELFERHDAYMLAPVYDEVAAFVHKDFVVNYVRELRELMQVPIPNSPVTLLADVSIGPNWGDQTELGTDPTEEAILEAVNSSVEHNTAKFAELRGEE